jgi:hypothetical protein
MGGEVGSRKLPVPEITTTKENCLGKTIFEHGVFLRSGVPCPLGNIGRPVGGPKKAGRISSFVFTNEAKEANVRDFREALDGACSWARIDKRAFLITSVAPVVRNMGNGRYA